MTSHLVIWPGGRAIKEQNARLLFLHLTTTILFAMHSLRSATRPITRSVSRRFSTTVPPLKPGPGTPPSEDSKNTALYVGTAAVGLGGLYYYYFMSSSHARSDAERVKQKSRELGETAKDSAHHKLQQGQDKVDEYRASGKEKLDRTRQEAERAKDDARDGARDVKSTVSEYGHDAQRKFDEYKTSAHNTLADARDNTEKKLEEAKSTGSSWLSWGSSNANNAKKEGAEKIKEGAETVKQKADKHS
ncbi:hypothetical protein BJ322DRAFT_1030063 [Thelephora terrestris]|uniref:Late embryogenesis abundant protein n=1 Tax=Thelephora terrestris TaxID=56493 RepID=A0A9P6HRK2_9AGAM|nr:hypothetical protein BJ322DRAFT_1030063 [Thelephora terrestris]